MIHGTLRSIVCKCAVALKWFDEAPRMPPLPKKSLIKPDVMQDEDVNAILNAALDPQQKLAMMLSSDAGLRPAEVRELRWGDVQKHRFRRADGTVVEQLVLHVRRGYAAGQVTRTKTGRERIVPVTPRLEAHLKSGPAEELVTADHGERWGRKTLIGVFSRAARRARVKGSWRFYDLRHYFCTSLFRARVNPRVIMSLMGHADMMTTLRYAHVVQEDLFDGLQAMAAFVASEASRASSNGKTPEASTVVHTGPMDPKAA